MIRLRNILLIDDDEINNYINRKMIESNAKIKVDEIQEFPNGEEALLFLTKNPGFLSTLDLIILDINMPRMDGFEFLRVLPRIHPVTDSENIPVMMLSSSLRQEDKVKSLSFNNVKAYYSKPLSSQILSDFVKDNVLVIR